jgi:tricorn protease
MRHPTLSATKIAFEFGGEIWEVPRAGGEAVRLTASGGKDHDPVFSPDGSKIAFSGVYDGNVDVYVMPSGGGEPRRMTSHPDSDVPVAWTPDGKAVVFTSSMLSNTDYPRLFTVPLSGGLPVPLPFPSGTDVAFAPDGKRVAYVPTTKWELAWKRYRGGQTAPIWIADLADSKVHAIPRDNTDDHRPMWIGNSIYFLSDPTGPVDMYRYDFPTGKISDVIPGAGFDIKYASVGPDAIVYERLGSVWLYSLSTHQSTQVPVSIHGDFTEIRPSFKDVSHLIHSVAISPTGKRVVVEARGWIFTVPAKKGDARLLDGSQGVHRRDPAWSPDGKTIAYISDEDGDQKLALFDLASAKERRIPLGDPPAFYSEPLWSPDSERIAYKDTRLKLWVLDVASGKSTEIDQGTYRGRTDIDPKWSPDSQWLVWSRDLPSNVKVVIVHSFATGKSTQITDGLAEATSPIFDRSGKYLYFLASTDVGVGGDFEDMSSLTAREPTSSVYAVVLRKDLPNPLQPESDEEGVASDAAKGEAAKGEAAKPESAKADAAKPDAPKKDAVPKVDIDFDGIERRIIALPMPRAGYERLEAGPAGSFFAVVIARGGPASIHKFNFSDRKDTVFAEGARSCMVSADGSQVLLYPGPPAIVPASAPTKGSEGALTLTGLTAKIDPRAEWRAMYHEVWRDERLLLYDPNMHGIDSRQMERRYEPFLAELHTREDLNYLFTDMLGEITIGHMWASGGDSPGTRTVSGGLLGADFTFDSHRYRLTRVYDGERWNPDLYAPLAQPGVDAKPGEYLLAIDGKDLLDATDLYEALEGRAGKQIKLRIGPTPDGKGARVVTVVPVSSEFGLRNRAWEEDNRRLVAKATEGRAGYVHVPDTGGGGWAAFNRYYYAQADRTGMIVDDRFNHGGFVNDWMVREMEKPLDFMSRTRHGQDIKMPMAAVFGPKVMLINEMAGSGGDIFPFLFRQDKVGPLVGKRTWGAMLSAYGFEIIDGGHVNAPDDAMYNPRTGKWIIENWGTAPDIDVDLDPYLWRQGRDSQLEAAIAELKRQMEAHPPIVPKRPDYPNKSKIPALGNGT